MQSFRPGRPAGGTEGPEPGCPLPRDNFSPIWPVGAAGRLPPPQKMPDIRELCRQDVAWRTFLGGWGGGGALLSERGVGGRRVVQSRLLWPPAPVWGRSARNGDPAPRCAAPLSRLWAPGEPPSRARRAGHGAGPLPAPGEKGNLPASPRLQAAPPSSGTCEPGSGSDGRALTARAEMHACPSGTPKRAARGPARSCLARGRDHPPRAAPPGTLAHPSPLASSFPEN